MKDYIYLGIIAVMFVVFLILHIKQNNRITKLMNRYEKFMKGKNAENLSAAIEENFQQMDKLQQAYTSNEEKMDKTYTAFYIGTDSSDRSSGCFICSSPYDRKKWCKEGQDRYRTYCCQ